MLETKKIVNKKGLKLSVALETPEKNRTSLPAVILLQGFVGHKDGEKIASLSKHLVQLGFVTLRFDPSGFGESEGNTLDEYSISNFVSDIESVYQFLLGQDFIDKSKIGVWGQSMGGMLSIIFASQHPEIKASCAISSPAQIIKGDDLEKVIEKWQENGYLDRRSSKYGEIKISYNFVIDARKWNAEKLVKKVRVPLLMILGKNDEAVPPDITRKIFQEANEPKELIEIDNMQHDYKENPGLMQEINKIVGDFFLKNL